MDLSLTKWSFYLKDGVPVLSGDIYNVEGILDGTRIQTTEVISVIDRHLYAVVETAYGWKYYIAEKEFDYDRFRMSEACCKYVRFLEDFLKRVQFSWNIKLESLPVFKAYEGTFLTEELIDSAIKLYKHQKQAKEYAKKNLINNLQADELLIICYADRIKSAIYKDASGACINVHVTQCDLECIVRKDGLVDFRMLNSCGLIPYYWSDNLKAVKIFAYGTVLMACRKGHVKFIDSDECWVLTKNDFYGEGMFSAEYIYGGVQV